MSMLGWVSATVMAAWLVYAVIDTFRYQRLRRTLRHEGGWYIWLELDGSERRSRNDPRERGGAWNTGGDGYGGDGSGGD